MILGGNSVQTVQQVILSGDSLPERDNDANSRVTAVFFPVRWNIQISTNRNESMETLQWKVRFN
jgi:hypothetical protein